MEQRADLRQRHRGEIAALHRSPREQSRDSRPSTPLSRRRLTCDACLDALHPQAGGVGSQRPFRSYLARGSRPRVFFQLHARLVAVDAGLFEGASMAQARARVNAARHVRPRIFSEDLEASAVREAPKRRTRMYAIGASASEQPESVYAPIKAARLYTITSWTICASNL